jgi:hypothetical protein
MSTFEQGLFDYDARLGAQDCADTIQYRGFLEAATEWDGLDREHVGPAYVAGYTDALRRWVLDNMVVAS